MKVPALVVTSVAIGSSVLLLSCDREDENSFQMSVVQTQEELAREAQFTVWVSQAELQFLKERLLQGDYFSAVEGRLKGGENQYRAITRPLDTRRYTDSVSFWGLTSEELYFQELDHLRKGFEKVNSQVFTDSTGMAIHQLVMHLPKHSPVYDVVKPGSLASTREEQSPMTDGDLPDLSDRGEANGDVEESQPEVPVAGVVASRTPKEAPIDWLAGERSLDEVVEESKGKNLKDVIGLIDSPNSPGTEESVVGIDGSAPEIVASSIDETNVEEIRVEESVAGIDEPAPEIVALETDEPKITENGIEEPQVEEVVVESDEPVTESVALETKEPEVETEEPKIATEETEVAEPAPALKTIRYKVVRGDNLTIIARRFKVSINDIKKASGIRSDMLRVSQILKIPNQP